MHSNSACASNCDRHRVQQAYVRSYVFDVIIFLISTSAVWRSPSKFNVFVDGNQTNQYPNHFSLQDDIITRILQLRWFWCRYGRICVWYPNDWMDVVKVNKFKKPLTISRTAYNLQTAKHVFLNCISVSIESPFKIKKTNFLSIQPFESCDATE